jgi:hypothetical protein
VSGQIRKPLPESLMKAIKATAESPDLTAQEKFEAVVLTVHGYGLFARNDGSIDPQGFAIPEQQWGAISDMIRAASRTTDPISQVNWALDWMNVGPSGYKPEEES